MEEKRPEEKKLPMADKLAKWAYGHFSNHEHFNDIKELVPSPEILAEHISKEGNLLLYARLLSAYSLAEVAKKDVDRAIAKDIKMLIEKANLAEGIKPEIEKERG